MFVNNNKLYYSRSFQQQQQLYTEAEESLPPAEEVESDRQQRVYRGQPSTGNVQRDRDGIRHSNAIPVSTCCSLALNRKIMLLTKLTVKD